MNEQRLFNILPGETLERAMARVMFGMLATIESMENDGSELVAIYAKELRAILNAE